jgi:3alpha(or 20beta)-hydroxysteroid dehydrogenase
MSGRLCDRVIVVTGAGRGQGAAHVAALTGEGAVVIAADLEPDGALEQPRVHRRRLDVSDQASWSALADWLRQRFARVDGLVNNAGVTSRVRIGDVGLDEWNRVLAVNLTGPMLGLQALLPLMGRGASVINVGSVAGLTGHYTAAYTSSKWGLRGLTLAAAMELGPRGIRVNAVHPGYIETPMTAGAPPRFKDANESLTPLGRVGDAQEVSGLIVFLMSDDSTFLSGAEIPIDGGLSGCGVAKALSDALR